MSEARLKAKLWVHAAIRQCTVLAIPAVVVAKGDEDSGDILVKVNRGPAGCEVFTRVRDGAGEPAWMRATGPAPVPEEKADSYIAKRRHVDSDLWVVEVEDREGRTPFLERIIDA